MLLFLAILAGTVLFLLLVVVGLLLSGGKSNGEE